MHLWIVRHGHPETAVDGPLTPRGEQEATLTANYLAAAGITHIISSPLIRALATATIIARELGDQPIHVWPGLREGFSYQHRGQSRAELQTHFPNAVFPPDFAPDGWEEGGDTYELVLARCREALTRLHSTFTPEDHILLVAHGGFINHLLNIVLNIPPAAPAWFQTYYCSITRLHFTAETDWVWPLYPPVAVELLSLNDISHLPHATHDSSRA